MQPSNRLLEARSGISFPSRIWLGRLLFAFCLLLILSLPAPASAQGDKTYHVMLLNSYHQGYKWSDDETEGIRAALPDNVEVFIEYMDTKREFNEPYLDLLAETYRVKYENVLLDCIIALDDNALNFILDHRADLFPDVPVIFGGINNFKESMLEGQDNITGLTEPASITETFDTILHLYPGTEQIIVINDLTTSGLEKREAVEEAVEQGLVPVEVVYLDDGEGLTLDEVMEAVADTPVNSVLFFIGFFRPEDGHYLPMETTVPVISEAASAPIFVSGSDTFMGYGVVGGKMVIGRQLGEAVGELAMRVLNGESPDSIPVALSPVTYIFDYTQLRRWNIPLSALPKDSIVINQPHNFYTENLAAVWSAITIVLLQSSIIGFLLMNVRKRRRIEQTLRESEDRYRSLVEQSPIPIALHSNGKIVFVNSEAIRTLGGDPDNAVLGMPVLQFIHPDYHEMITRRIDNNYGGYEEKVNLVEQKFVRLDGKIIDVEVAVAATTLDGKPAAQVVFRDITDRKSAEEALEKRTREIGLLYEAGEKLGQSLELPAIYDTVYGIVRGVMDCDSLSISSYTPADDLIRCQYLRHDGERLDETELPPLTLNEEGHGTQSRVIHSGKALLLDDYRAYLRTAERGYNVEVKENGSLKLNEDDGSEVDDNVDTVRSALIVPLVIENEVRGVIQVFSYRLAAYTQDNLRFLEALAPQIAAATANANLYLQAQQEIADRKRAETALRESERTLATLMGNLPGMAYRCKNDQQYTMEFISEGCKELTGYPPESLIGNKELGFNRIIHPDDRQLVWNTIQNAIGINQHFQLSYRIITVDHQTRWVWEQGSAVRDDDGKVIALEGFISDITQRRAAEEEVHQRAAQLLVLNEVIGQIASELDEGGVLAKSAALIQRRFSYQHVGLFMLDHAGEELVMKARAGTYAELFPESHRLNLAEGIVGWVATNQQILMIGDVSKDDRFYNPFPEQIIGSEMSIPIRLGQQLLGVLDIQSRSVDAFDTNDALVMKTLADALAVAIQNARLYKELENYSQILELAVEERTAELRRTSERVQTILDNSPDVILLLSGNGHIETTSPSFYPVFGFESDEVYKRPLTAFAGEDSLASLTAALENVLENQVQQRLEFTAERKDHTTFDADIALAPVVEKGELLNVVASLRDISALKNVERMKDSFLSTAAHELRTPLTSILGFSEILVTRQIDAHRQSRYLTMINDQSAQLANIIDDMLDISRLESGRGLEIKTEPFDMVELVHDVMQPIVETTPDRNFHCSGFDAPIPTLGDPFRLTQVIRNLLSNAIKYSLPGDDITLQSKVNHNCLEISVIDTGIGMTAEQQRHLFQKFYRADASNRSIGGTGLGLTICKLIIEGHGGEIRVDSEPDRGTTFTFTIPLVGSKASPGD
ncbi:MAG: PAS domain S-box protein [Anaerolineae bacterium]|nr:PAS domain S-box protein [Anaerolineae bacterium]